MLIERFNDFLYTFTIARVERIAGVFSGEKI